MKMHHFRGSLPKWVLTPQRKTSCLFFKLPFFSKLFGDIMSNIIWQDADEKLKYFFELFISKNFEYTFSLSFVIGLYFCSNWQSFFLRAILSEINFVILRIWVIVPKSNTTVIYVSAWLRTHNLSLVRHNFFYKE